LGIADQIGLEANGAAKAPELNGDKLILSNSFAGGAGGQADQYGQRHDGDSGNPPTCIERTETGGIESPAR
jgi:hypothetical protein